MAIDIQPGQTVRVTVNKQVTRESARKTIERLFLQDKQVRKPIEVRERNFQDLPKRRGGRIWTKRPNKVHPTIQRGSSATIRTTPQTLKDLNSVESFVTVEQT